MFLEGDHAAAEAQGRAAAARARALHARRDRRSSEDLRRVARGRARRSDCAPHVVGVHRPRGAAARVGRVRRADVRQLRGELRVQARAAVLPRARARGGGAGDDWARGRETARRPRRRLRHGAVRPARRPVRAPAHRRRSLRGHARAREGEERLRRARSKPSSPNSSAGAPRRSTSSSPPTRSCISAALESVFSAAAGALRPDGVFVFTLEHAADVGPDVESHLQYHGRYSHARPYVERALARAGFESAIVQAELRMEAGSPVAGLVVRARRR